MQGIYLFLIDSCIVVLSMINPIRYSMIGIILYIIIFLVFTVLHSYT